jgi:glycogen operon protein
MPTRRLEAGRSYPLGATWDGTGANFALFSAHAERVDLCIFDARGRREIARHTLPEYTDEVWHGYLPGLRPGALYGYRVYGPYDPANGHRFNHHKLLLDPYAKALSGTLRWSDAHYGYRIGASRGDLSFDRRDNAGGMPKSVVVDTSFTWGADRSPDVPWMRTVFYETHVRGYTMLHPDVPPAARGTFLGLASPRVVEHLVNLGVTTVELLPVQAFIDDRYLVEKRLRNYWGYNTIGYFAPESRYLSAHHDEFKTMVKTLHEAGLEVILDVVYNHTAEGNHLGPTLSFRGIDNRAYYRLAEDKRYYEDATGCGNTLDLRHPRVLQLVTDSLRYWVEEMHVDGFRFDLAPALAREEHGYDYNAGFFKAIRQDPVLSRCKLVAEPWDVGPGGYQLGGFPPGWSEWNGRYRDTVRRYWRGRDGMLSEFASRLAGSSDVFAKHGRRPRASINFVTVHDGFTLADLVSYDAKHNDANFEGNHDGSDDNASWNCGVEGATADPAILALRERQKRNLLATLLISLGVPLLLAGDEFGHSQRGNNNAYCQDNEISWLDWNGRSARDLAFGDFVKTVLRLRREHPAFQYDAFFTGRPRPGNDRKDIAWYTPAGTEMTGEDWQGAGRAIGVFFGDRPLFAVLFNAADADVTFTLPESATVHWRLILDTASDVQPAGASADVAVTTYDVTARSVAVFNGIAP